MKMGRRLRDGGNISEPICSRLTLCRRPILIATKYLVFRGQDTRAMDASRRLHFVRDSIVHQMINFNRDQADIIRKVFCRCELLNLVDQLLAKFVSAETG